MARILFVDDDELVRQGLVIGLERAAHEVVEAENGKQALALLLDPGNFDVMILDILMPERDGFEVLRDMKKLPINQPRVITLSGGGLLGKPEVFLEASMSLGADAQLAKPVSIAALLETIEGVLG